jgi:amino acid transporter
MNVPSPDADHSDEQLNEFGYKQELVRALGKFSSFAASFSGVGISAGVFITLPVIWASSGTGGIWSWIPSSVGALLVGLIFADLVGRMPIAGYAYQWSSRLANRPIGWMTGVAGFLGFGIGTAGTIYGVTPYFLSEFGIDVTTASTIVGGIIMTAVVCTVLIVGTKLAAMINNVAVFIEFLGGIIAAVVLLIVAVVRHPHPVSVLFQPAPGTEGTSYGYAFLLAFLLGAFLYAGWELPADMAEETKDAPNTAARTMLWSIGAVAISGLVMVVAFSYASPDIATTLQSPTPALSVFEFQFGATAAQIYNTLLLVAFFAVSLLITAGATRLLFSMSRDGLAPGSKIFKKVTARTKTPAAATVAVGLFAIVMFTVPQLYSTDVQGTIFGTASVGYNLVYAAMAGIFLYKLRSGGLPASFGRFTLGRWAQPIAVVAFLWQLFVVGTLTLPSQNHQVGWTTLILLAIGALWYVVRIRPRSRAAAAEQERAQVTARAVTD